MEQPYKTVANAADCEIVIQKSRFIGHCFPLESQEAAEEKLVELRKAYADASHNCYAYTIGLKGEIVRFSDDGEPGGTAGRPMMEVLKAQELANVLVVVTRYFGGVLLGAGGLVRAYSRAAADAIMASGVITMLPTRHYSLSLSYPQWNRLQHPLENSSYRIENVQYGEQVEILLAVKADDEDTFMQDIKQRSDGQLEPNLRHCDFWQWPDVDKKVLQ